MKFVLTCPEKKGGAAKEALEETDPGWNLQGTQHTVGTVQL